MLIYGTREAHLRTQNIPGQCPYCKTKDNLQMSVYQKYVHVFWIPFFPVTRDFTTRCSHCNQVLQENEVKQYFKDSYIELKSQARIPIWTFTGLGLLALIITNLVISINKDNKQNEEFVKSPQIGDIYEYKTKEGHYTLLKVQRIAGDTIYFLQNHYETNNITGLTKLRDSVYREENFPFMKVDLLKMLEKNEIIDVDRE